MSSPMLLSTTTALRYAGSCSRSTVVDSIFRQRNVTQKKTALSVGQIFDRFFQVLT
jgi:hypothetical protein